MITYIILFTAAYIWAPPRVFITVIFLEIISLAWTYDRGNYD